MPLTPGTQLGPYEIAAKIGVGGMGEVYRAHDSRLRRDVAIKTSSQQFSDRFLREARAIAALNHPNVCTLHDIGPDYLVMELVEGVPPRGPLPLSEALHIAGQVASALDAAHARGLVHRDLKPANVSVTPSGLVKVLDFGLAKLVDAVRTDDSTVTVTQAGMAVGTPAYMAPEQAQGKEVTTRADVWAFGVLLYELLTGHGPFHADSAQAALTAVQTREPDWNVVPVRCRRLLKACLKKDPRERLSSLADWRLLLDDDGEPAPAARATTPLLPWVAATLGTAVGVAGLAFATFGSSRTDAPADRTPLVRFEIPIPGGVSAQTTFELSPDGRSLAIAAADSGQLRLWVRPLDGVDARLLPGTDGARYPFWKPDGTQIGFFADGKLKAIAVGGGPPAILANVDPTVLGAAWSSEGTIVLSQARELYSVAERGGTPTLLYRGPGIPFEPAFLPGGQRFLFREGGLFVGALDGTAPVKLLDDRTRGYYSRGHLVFSREGRLVAQPFDAATLTLTGAAVPVTSDDILQSSLIQAVSVTDSAMAYQASSLEQLVWKDRAGNVVEKVGPPQLWTNFRLSPDQTRIAWDLRALGGVAVYDVRRGTRERFTTLATDLVGMFSPDGKRLAFTSQRTGRFNPYVTAAPNEERMIADVGTTGGYPVDWSPDGRHLLYWGDEDLWIVTVDGAEKPYKYATSAFEEREGAFSPDGRWIAYASNRSGTYEVYVQPFPERRGQSSPVSSQGGSSPAWRRDGKELFYVSGDGRLTSLPVTIRETAIELGRPQPLFPVPPSDFHRSYELSSDGQRVLVTVPAAAGGATIRVTLNWHQVLAP